MLGCSLGRVLTLLPPCSLAALAAGQGSPVPIHSCSRLAPPAQLQYDTPLSPSWLPPPGCRSISSSPFGEGTGVGCLLPRPASYWFLFISSPLLLLCCSSGLAWALYGSQSPWGCPCPSTCPSQPLQLMEVLKCSGGFRQSRSRLQLAAVGVREHAASPSPRAPLSGLQSVILWSLR